VQASSLLLLLPLAKAWLQISLPAPWPFALPYRLQLDVHPPRPDVLASLSRLPNAFLQLACLSHRPQVVDGVQSLPLPVQEGEGEEL
jgi:hypothetical protein